MTSQISSPEVLKILAIVGALLITCVAEALHTYCIAWSRENLIFVMTLYKHD